MLRTEILDFGNGRAYTILALEEPIPNEPWDTVSADGATVQPVFMEHLAPNELAISGAMEKASAVTFE